MSNIGLDKKFVFFDNIALEGPSLTSFETVLLDCIVTAVISACIKKTITIGEFLYSHFNIEDGRKYTFLVYHALLFQKG